MDIFSLFTLLGGFAIFIFGMGEMSNGLEKLAGSKLEQILKQMTSSKWKSLFLGILITALIQSSSATTVMLVGLVNSGIMQLSSSVGVIMGSNVGTTVTAWLLSLVGLESSNFFIKMLKPDSFSPILAFIGIILHMTAKTSKKKDIGTTLIGFALLIFGMGMMSDAVSPLADMPEFSEAMAAFNNPLIGLAIGIGITAIIQSSSASVGILQAVALTGVISYEMAFPIIMGQNIGTCVTALISSFGVGKSAKKVAVIHILFNVIGTTLFLLAFQIASVAFDLPILKEMITPAGIAVLHTVFNITTTLLLMPFANVLVSLSQRIIKGDDDEDEKHDVAFMDERLLNTPSIALSECNHLTTEMARLAEKSIVRAVDCLYDYTPEKEKKIVNIERKVDKYEDRLGSFLVKLSSHDLSDDDSMQISKLLHTISDFERISDHATDIVSAGKEMKEKNIRFSEEAKEELEVITAALQEVVLITFNAFDYNDINLANKVEPIETVIHSLVEKSKTRHIARLKAGNCTIELGFVLQDILNNYQRVSDHCSNIAVALIELSKASFETHEYMHQMKRKDNDDFHSLVQEYKDKYYI